MRHVIAMLPVLLLTACVTVDEDGYSVTEGQKNKPAKGRLERIHETVDARIERMQFQNGKELLRTLQELIAMKELAFQPIVAALPDADPRTRANLIYVLGFMKGSNGAHAVLARSLKDESEVVRFESAAALMNLGDWSAVPVLITFMEKGNRRLRYKSHEVLRQSTSQDFGFDFDADATVRATALTRWKAWWKGRRDEMIYEGRVGN